MLLRILYSVLTVAMVVACSITLFGRPGGLQPPTTQGVCFLMTSQAGEGRYRRLADSHNLESCASQIETVRLRTPGHPSLTGAYQGRFIFATPEAVRSAVTWRGVRYWVFTGRQQQEIDKKLLALMAQQQAGPALSRASPAP